MYDILYDNGLNVKASDQCRSSAVEARPSETTGGWAGAHSGPHTSERRRGCREIRRISARRQLAAIRVDAGVLDHFRKESRRRRAGYPTLINEVLARRHPVRSADINGGGLLASATV